MGKAYKDYTVSDIKRLDLSFLKKQFPEHTTKMRDNIEYVARISNDMGHNTFGARPFLETFPQPFYEYEKQDINKVIHTALQEDQEAIKNAVRPDFQRALLNKFTSTDAFKSTRKEDLEQNILRCEENMASYRNNMESYMGNYRNAQQSLLVEEKVRDEYEEELSVVDENSINVKLVRQVENTIATGDWIYMGSYTGSGGDRMRIQKYSRSRTVDESERQSEGEISFWGHTFMSSKPITLSYVNQAANVSMSMDMGYLLVSLTDAGNINQCRFVINTIGNGSGTHPHLSNGSICWGTASSRFNNLCSNSNPNFPAVLGLLKSLLETYCPDEPYVSMKEVYGYRNARITCCLPDNMLELVPEGIFQGEIAEKMEAKRTAVVRQAAFLKDCNDVLTYRRVEYSNLNARQIELLAILKDIQNKELLGTAYYCANEELDSLSRVEKVMHYFEGCDIPKLTREDLKELEGINVRVQLDDESAGTNLLMWCKYSGFDYVTFASTGREESPIMFMNFQTLDFFGSTLRRSRSVEYNGGVCIKRNQTIHSSHYRGYARNLVGIIPTTKETFDLVKTKFSNMSEIDQLAVRI